MKFLRSVFSSTIINISKFQFKIYVYRALKSVKASTDLPGSIGKQTLLDLLNESPVIVEVGAHVGIDTLEFSVMYPRGQVISFEPQSNLYRAASKRTEFASNVTIFPFAIAEDFSIRTFHVSSGSSTGSSSLLKPSGHLINHPDVIFDQNNSQIVVTVPLGRVCNELGINEIDLLWIDTQGAELLVLKSAESVLKNVKYIYLECSEVPLYETAPTYDELKTFLASQGFKLHKEYMPTSWGGEGNALFTNQMSV